MVCQKLPERVWLFFFCRQNLNAIQTFLISDVGQQQLLYILAKHSDRTEHLTFGDLPPIENFAKGMPELPFQEEATEFSGRLRKVIDLIKKTRDTQGKPKNDNDDDDDVQIIN